MQLIVLGPWRFGLHLPGSSLLSTCMYHQRCQDVRNAPRLSGSASLSACLRDKREVTIRAIRIFKYAAATRPKMEDVLFRLFLYEQVQFHVIKYIFTSLTNCVTSLPLHPQSCPCTSMRSTYMYMEMYIEMHPLCREQKTCRATRDSAFMCRHRQRAGGLRHHGTADPWLLGPYCIAKTTQIVKAFRTPEVQLLAFSYVVFFFLFLFFFFFFFIIISSSPFPPPLLLLPSPSWRFYHALLTRCSLAQHKIIHILIRCSTKISDDGLTPTSHLLVHSRTLLFSLLGRNHEEHAGYSAQDKFSGSPRAEIPCFPVYCRPEKSSAFQQ